MIVGLESHRFWFDSRLKCVIFLHTFVFHTFSDFPYLCKKLAAVMNSQKLFSLCRASFHTRNHKLSTFPRKFDITFCFRCQTKVSACTSLNFWGSNLQRESSRVELLSALWSEAFPSSILVLFLHRYACNTLSKPPQYQFPQWPFKRRDYLMKWETAIMAIFTTYLALTRISIPKEKYEKYRFIAFLSSQGRIICDYTLYSCSQSGISWKMCFFFRKFSCSLGPNFLAVSQNEEVSQYLELKHDEGGEEVSSPQLIKLFRHTSKKQTLVFLSGWALMWDCDV